MASAKKSLGALEIGGIVVAEHFAAVVDHSIVIPVENEPTVV
jgi:hypothetical protein